LKKAEKVLENEESLGFDDIFKTYETFEDVPEDRRD